MNQESQRKERGKSERKGEKSPRERERERMEREESERKSEKREKKERARNFHTHICLFIDIMKTNVQVQEDKDDSPPPRTAARCKLQQCNYN